MGHTSNRNSLKWLFFTVFAKTILGISIFMFFYSCKDTPTATTSESSPKVNYAEISIPDFNADSAYHFVEKQVAFGSRVPGSKAHDQCAEYLIKKLHEYTDTVIVQNFHATRFDNTPQNGINIIGIINPQAETRIMLSSHWDSRPFADHDPVEDNHNKPILGANDGASGVGVLLEIARILQTQKPEIGIDIILFDLEDGGTPDFMESNNQHTWCLGSQYWAKNKHFVYYHAKYGILLDMVGAANATFYKEETSMYFAPALMDKVWEVARQKGYENYFINQPAGGITDDHLYVNEYASIPMIDIVHLEPRLQNRFFKHWHTIHDDMSNISKETLQVVGNVLLTLIFSEKL